MSQQVSDNCQTPILLPWVWYKVLIWNKYRYHLRCLLTLFTLSHVAILDIHGWFWIFPSWCLLKLCLTKIVFGSFISDIGLLCKVTDKHLGFSFYVYTFQPLKVSLSNNLMYLKLILECGILSVTLTYNFKVTIIIFGNIASPGCGINIVMWYLAILLLS